MHFIFTLFVLLAFPLIMFAQPFAGQKLLGGSVNVLLSTSERSDALGRDRLDSEESSFSVGPQSGLLLSEKLAIGLNLSYQHYRATFVTTIFDINGQPIHQEQTTATSQYAFSPFLRFYLPVPEQRFGAIVEPAISVQFGRSRQEAVDLGAEARHRLFGLGLSVSPRLYYFLTNSFALEASFGGVGYNYYRSTEILPDVSSEVPDEHSGSSLGLNLNTGLGLGFRVYW